MNRFFARSKFLHLTPGPWVELSQFQYERICSVVKAPVKSFEKNGAQGCVVLETVPAATFQYVDPELYSLLVKPNPYAEKEKSVEDKQAASS